MRTNSYYNNVVKCIYNKIIFLFFFMLQDYLQFKNIIYFDFALTFYYAGKFYVNRKMELRTFLKYIYDSITIPTFFISLAVKYIKNISLMKEAFKGL